MSLGDFFPPDLKSEFAKRNIDLGTALLINVPDFKIAYDKYIIIVAKDNKAPSFAYVVINSIVNQNIAYSKSLKCLHLKIDKENHPFLKRDSFVDCSSLREYTVKKVVEFLIENPERVVGNVTPSVLKKINIRVSGAKTITPFMKKKYGF